MKKRFLKYFSIFFSIIITFNFLLLTACTDKEVETVEEHYVSLSDDFTDEKITDEKSAIKAVKNIAMQFGMDNPEKELKVSSVNRIDGDSFYRMQQYYKDIPVYGKAIVLSADKKGNSTALTTNIIKLKDIDIKPSISQKKVNKSIKKYFNTEDVEIENISKDNLYIYNEQNENNILVYVVFVTTETEHYKLFVDAKNGKIIKKLSLNYYDKADDLSDKDKISVIKKRDRKIEIYNANDKSVDKTSILVDKNGKEYTVISENDVIRIYDSEGNELTIDDDLREGKWKLYDTNDKLVGEDVHLALRLSLHNSSEKITKLSDNPDDLTDPKSIKALYNTSVSYDFYYDILNRKGFNGYDSLLKVVYNDNLFDDSSNAACKTTGGKFAYFLTFGTENPISLDTVGHEFTHGVEQTISQMDYEGESGAIMEAYSDIFGELIEDYSKNGLNGDCDWIHGDRNMISPESEKQYTCRYWNELQQCPIAQANDGRHGDCVMEVSYPSKYNGENWVNTTFTTNDQGGVHTNNTVLSHAAYLMVNGINGNAGKKISTSNIAKLWYRALNLLHSNATFKQCANAVILSAEQMHQKNPDSFTVNHLICVNEAFDKVGISSDISAGDVVKNGSVIYAIEQDGNRKYDNYHVLIERIDLSTRSYEKVIEVDVKDENGYTIDLPEDMYRVTVTDNAVNGSEYEYKKILRVINVIPDEPLRPNINNIPVAKKVYIYTDFKTAIPVTDFTIPSDKIITLGELGVIEPEITPADATGYSIKWTSSNDSVAKVSPTGEAGIITTLTKGNTIVTAKLTSGGKTITKTTSLRVASKARDTVLVLDISGSMGGRPLEEMKKSAIQFCNDLLKDQYNNRVGIVFYNEYVTKIGLTSDLNMLISQIESVYANGRTNMESALSTADTMLKNSSKTDTIKNVVIMADGYPNEGRKCYTNYMPDISGLNEYDSLLPIANAVIDTAKRMMKEYNMYSLGFFHGGQSKYSELLMKELTNQTDGYHQVDEATDLQFAFGDISEDINIGSKIVINIACPVDVKVSYGNEILSSSKSNFCDSTTFGTLQLLGKDKDIKVVSLDSDNEYEIEMIGIGEGKMDYSVNYFDEKEQLSDYRSFETVPVTSTMIIKSSTDNSSENIALNIDEDGDGNVDTIWTAKEKSKGEITYEKNPPESEKVEEFEIPEPETPVKPKQDFSVEAVAIGGAVAFMFIIFGVIAVVAVASSGKSNSEFNDSGKNASLNMVRCLKCGKSHPDNKPCDCYSREKQKDEAKEHSEGYIEVTNGSMNGLVVPVHNEEILYLGRDPKLSNLVFTSDYKRISRVHCTVTYNAKLKKYYVTDCSSNGTYLNNKERLVKGKRTSVNANTVLILGGKECTVLLR